MAQEHLCQAQKVKGYYDRNTQCSIFASEDDVLVLLILQGQLLLSDILAFM